MASRRAVLPLTEDHSYPGTRKRETRCDAAFAKPPCNACIVPYPPNRTCHRQWIAEVVCWPRLTAEYCQRADLRGNLHLPALRAIMPKGRAQSTCARRRASCKELAAGSCKAAGATWQGPHKQICWTAVPECGLMMLARRKPRTAAARRGQLSRRAPGGSARLAGPGPARRRSFPPCGRPVCLPAPCR